MTQCAIGTRISTIGNVGAGQARDMTERGRPSLYTQEVAQTICDQLAQGVSLRKICKPDEMPHEATVRRWVVEDYEGFATQYTRARDIGLDCVADEVFEIADDGTDHQRDRLRFDARRWYLSKLAPKRYGDKIAHVGGDPEQGDKPIQGTIKVEGLSESALREIAALRVEEG